jgi:mRNA interferase MazF
MADLEPVVGREQGRIRPVLILSTNRFNHGPAELVIIAPLTRTKRNIPMHIEVNPPEGGPAERSYILCDHIRSISRDRLRGNVRGVVSPRTMALVEDRLGILLDL